MTTACNHQEILMQGMHPGPKAHGLESNYATIFVHCKTNCYSISRQISILSSSSLSLLAYDVCSVVSYRAMFGGCHTLGE